MFDVRSPLDKVALSEPISGVLDQLTERNHKSPWEWFVDEEPFKQDPMALMEITYLVIYS
jgi:hypothetical protein